MSAFVPTVLSSASRVSDLPAREIGYWRLLYRDRFPEYAKDCTSVRSTGFRQAADRPGSVKSSGPGAKRLLLRFD